MKTMGLKAIVCLALAWMTAAHGAPAPSKLALMEGNYSMAPSSPVPAKGQWYYTKGRLTIKRLDERHLLILLACQWRDEPKAQCDDWWTVQQRADGIYLTDINTSNLEVHFDPAERRLTMTSSGSFGAVHTEIFQIDDSAITDPALLRRMKRAQWSFDASMKSKPGDYKKWDYTEKRIVPLP